MRHSHRDDEWLVPGISGWVRGLLLAVLGLTLLAMVALAAWAVITVLFDLGRMAGCN